MEQRIMKQKTKKKLKGRHQAEGEEREEKSAEAGGK